MTTAWHFQLGFGRDDFDALRVECILAKMPELDIWSTPVGETTPRGVAATVGGREVWRSEEGEA